LASQSWSLHKSYKEWNQFLLMKIDTCMVEGWEIFMNENEISIEEMSGN
jgi:hypothetical protein